mmetsp:Transcript_18885/g.47193  ORF Transcript_18885/g.47193 Transcript_18885/m.47193 type:complete len:291 (-) Transcript_18885:91-963(-)
MQRLLDLPIRVPPQAHGNAEAREVPPPVLLHAAHVDPHERLQRPRAVCLHELRIFVRLLLRRRLRRRHAGRRLLPHLVRLRVQDLQPRLWRQAGHLLLRLFLFGRQHRSAGLHPRERQLRGHAGNQRQHLAGVGRLPGYRGSDEPVWRHARPGELRVPFRRLLVLPLLFELLLFMLLLRERFRDSLLVTRLFCSLWRWRGRGRGLLKRGGARSHDNPIAASNASGFFPPAGSRQSERRKLRKTGRRPRRAQAGCGRHRTRTRRLQAVVRDEQAIKTVTTHRDAKNAPPRA